MRRRFWYNEDNLPFGQFYPATVEVPGPRIELLYVNSLGIVSATYGLDSKYNETFYLTSPDGTSWQIIVNATTGIITAESGIANNGTDEKIIRDENNVHWTFAISNTGVISVTS